MPSAINRQSSFIESNYSADAVNGKMSIGKQAANFLSRNTKKAGLLTAYTAFMDFP